MSNLDGVMQSSWARPCPEAATSPFPPLIFENLGFSMALDLAFPLSCPSWDTVLQWQLLYLFLQGDFEFRGGRRSIIVTSIPSVFIKVSVIFSHKFSNCEKKIKPTEGDKERETWLPSSPNLGRSTISSLWFPIRGSQRERPELPFGPGCCSRCPEADHVPWVWLTGLISYIPSYCQGMCRMTHPPFFYVFIQKIWPLHLLVGKRIIFTKQ